MSLTLSPTVRNARVAALLAAIDGAATPATLRVYTAPQPTPGDAITTQTLLAEFTLDDPAGSVTGPNLTITLPDPVVVAADGAPAWARLSDGDDEWVLDGDAGLTGSGALFILDAAEWFASGLASLTSGTLTEA